MNDAHLSYFKLCLGAHMSFFFSFFFFSKVECVQYLLNEGGNLSLQDIDGR